MPRGKSLLYGMMVDFADEIRKMFSPSGALSSLDGFEFRPQQGQMAVAIAEALGGGTHLIVEAPTGTGKTIAYLIPALLFAADRQRKAIVSTHTKNLQEQILHKDVPMACTVLARQFDVAVLKGRRNYLCTTRLRNAMESTRSLFGDIGEKELGRIHRWSLTTETGDSEELTLPPDPEVWAMVCSEPGVCGLAECSTRCFFQKARERARCAQLVIMNHALFFRLLPAMETEDRFIYDDDFVIFDEAQALESVAGIGRRLSCSQILSAIHRLYNPKTKKGLLARQRKPVRDLCGSVEASAVELFASLQRAAENSVPRISGVRGPARPSVRIRTPHVVADLLSRPLAELQEMLADIEGRNASPIQKQELAIGRKFLAEAATFIDEVLALADPGCAYWVEGGGNRGRSTTLCSSPPDVSEIVGPMLFRQGSPVILTSATLSVDNRFDYFTRRLGAGDATTMILDSPFDHRRQMKLCIAADIPEPETEDYARALPRWIMMSIDRSGGKALVLFTSASLMNATAAAVAGAFEERGIKLLVQGTERPRHALLEQFREDVNSVLFGLDSFWMGIDVPGEALEHVIMTRLPFPVPNHPLVEAKLEALVRRGENAFTGYTLPEAVLKFRQGAGRLLRTREDRGIVTVLDSRIVRRAYGRTFLASLPRCPIEIISASGEVEELLVEDI